MNARTETKFLMREREMRISRRERGREGVQKEVEPTPVMGRREPLPTMIEEGEETAPVTLLDQGNEGRGRCGYQN